jgi:hypothetical protein
MAMFCLHSWVNSARLENLTETSPTDHTTLHRLEQGIEEWASSKSSSGLRASIGDENEDEKEYGDHEFVLNRVEMRSLASLTGLF